MATHQSNVIGFEINPKFVGALFTERGDDYLRVFCFYLNGEVANFELPALDNMDSLRHFFSALKMEETCSSMIVDQVIQSRFYVRSHDKFWLYTVLSSPGNVITTNNSDICNLPWRVCWRSQEAEILQYGGSSRSLPCYAIRTVISEGDATRLVKESKAFTSPVIVRKKRSSRRLVLGGIAAALFLGISAVVAGSLITNQKHEAPPPVPAPVAQPARPVAKQPVAEKYYLLNDRQITGPYTPAGIADMKACGLLKPGTLCRPENAIEWTSLDTVFPLLTSR